MSSRLHPLTFSILLAMSGLASAAPSGSAASAAVNLIEQSHELPTDFRDHFFNAPLTVRVDLNGDYLGDATMVLSPTNTVQVLAFTDVLDSKLPQSERDRWLAALAEPRELGECTTRCEDGLKAIDYSLEGSVLSLITADAERARAGASARHYSLPEKGSAGVILRNNLNLFAGGKETGSGSYLLDAQGSVGNWTTVGQYQVYRSGSDEALRHNIPSLYAQREFRQHYVRVGAFLPTFQGVVRQPNAPSNVAYSTVGVMLGTSDSLTVEDGRASLVPVYVTANRPGTAEIYRNGALIYTQPLEVGLQLIDTRGFPGGIYEVEIRVIEDGQVTARQSELINKPTNWTNLDRRWRYSAFAGQQRALLGSDGTPQGDRSIGGVVNYLAHPRAIVGLSAQQVGNQRTTAASLDWQARDNANLYTNIYHSNTMGSGLDFQGVINRTGGNLLLTHGRIWQTGDRRLGTRSGVVQTTSVGMNQQWGRSNLTARVSHNTGLNNGLGLDLSFNRRQSFFGSEGTWRLSVFDRPTTVFGQARRNRGVDFTLNVSLGSESRMYTGGLGTRSGALNGRDLYVNAGVQQQFAEGTLRQVSGMVSADSYGVGLNGSAQIDSRVASGNLYAQSSSLDGRVSGGLNLQNTLAIGGGQAAVAGRDAVSADTGMIINVDTDVPGLKLRAIDSQGGMASLGAGRNFVPVTAYKPGSLQLDFEGTDAPAAAIAPAQLSYHLNKGGVGSQTITVMRTLTVMGQLKDAQGKPLGGAQVHNHAGRSVAEADGFFTLEMSASQPELEIRHEGTSCKVTLDPTRYPQEGDTLMIGALSCPASTAP